MAIVLPTEKIKAVSQNPKNLILFGLPKVGKTTLLSVLPNCLILDLEDGSDYVEALKVKVKTVEDILEVCRQVKKAGNPYEFIAIDTITALEDICGSLAIRLYQDTALGKNYEGTNILTLPNGAGYMYLRMAFLKVIGWVESVCPNIILIGHVKDTQLEKAGVEFNLKDLDLIGKSKRIVSADSDAIGYVYRNTENQTCINFGGNDEFMCGARPEHLNGKDIVIAEKKDGEFISYWDRVYPSISIK
jgi:GTPase SAR1 family protein